MALFQPVNAKTNLREKYLVPPFSIFDTRSAEWQRRKKYWEDLGIESTLGRDTKRYNATPTNIKSTHGEGKVGEPESISTFDPMLAEVLISWFSHKMDTILDPFAGGSVRGIVAHMLDRFYYGIDLSNAQIAANREQVNTILDAYPEHVCDTHYLCGDSAHVLMDPDVELPMADMIFTCPPYYNMERYTKNPQDLSRCPSYTTFMARLAEVIALSVGSLRENRFFVIVVSEIRDPATGEFYGFVPDTIRACKQARLHYYNEIILKNNIGTLPIRAPKYFDDSCKVGRQHQNVLVFWKGDLEKTREFNQPVANSFNL